MISLGSYLAEHASLTLSAAALLATLVVVDFPFIDTFADPAPALGAG